MTKKARTVALLAASASALIMSGCVTTDGAQLKSEAKKATVEASKGPSEQPYRTVTNFSSSVRCMDSMFMTFGIRDLSILLEDLDDATKKVSVGTKDMMLTTTSDMTRRSRAIRFIAFGNDSRNAASFLDRAESKAAYSNLPQFGIRGSISQFDDNIAKASKDVGVGFGEWLTFGKSASATSKIVAIDLTVMNLADFSIVPGVASRNGVAIFSEGQGVDGEARYKKFGINYATSLSRSEGTAVAVRNLVELASVELLGKLTKVPYWKCLGLNEADSEVKREVEDWFESMSANSTELFGWWQYQMYIRGAYAGEVNGIPNKEFATALKNYKTAMGLKNDTDLNSEFMLTYLQADHASIMAKYETMFPKVQVSQESIAGRLSLRDGKTRIKPGDKLELELAVGEDGFASCYMQDDSRQIMRIVPNRFSRNAFVSKAKPHLIPDSPKLGMVASKKMVDEVVECYVTHDDVLNKLPAELGRQDLVPLQSFGSLDQVRGEYEKLFKTNIKPIRFRIPAGGIQ